MQRSCFVLIALSLLLTLVSCGAPTDQPAAATPQARDAAGSVILVEGDVRIVAQDQAVRRPGVGDQIFAGERVETGATGEVHFEMTDHTYVAVRPDSQLIIVEYRAQGDQDDRATLELLKGSFRTVTGWIARFNASNSVVRTPTATIGIRGTDHEPLVIPNASKLGEPGTYDRVYAGETTIRSTAGAIEVLPGRVGFASRGDRSPALLPHVPTFFRATRNERRFAGLHDRVQKQLPQFRRDRIKHIQQRNRLFHERPQERNRQGGQASPKEKGARGQPQDRQHGHKQDRQLDHERQTGRDAERHGQKEPRQAKLPESRAPREPGTRGQDARHPDRGAKHEDRGSHGKQRSD